MRSNRFWDIDGKAGKLYGRRWRVARAAFLSAHPLCAMCAGAGVTAGASVVDHIIPHRGNEALFWDETNWQPLCVRHHNSEKARIEILGYSDRIGADGWPLDPAHPTMSGRKPVSGRSRPDDILPIAVPVFLVVGAPGSGKTTWCQRRMQPDDVLIDVDMIAAEQHGPMRQRNRLVVPLLRERNERLRRAAMMTDGSVYLTAVLAKAEAREWWRKKLGNVTVVMVELSEKSCIQRIDSDVTRKNVADVLASSVQSWFRNVETGGVDLFVSGEMDSEAGGGGSVHGDGQSGDPPPEINTYLVSGKPTQGAETGGVY